MAITKQQIINRALAEVGITEYPPNSNKVKYNDWYYNKPDIQGDNYKWCVVFIQWIFKDSNLLPLRTANCSPLYNKFKELGQIVKDPQPGDLVFFKWDKSNYPCQHIGLVVSVGNSSIVTVEGNTSVNSNDNGGAVMKRQRKRNNAIVAYARPKYEDVPTQPTPTPKKSVDEVAWEIIKGKGGWGNNPGRRQKLEAAGYNYNEVRDRVNQLMTRK